MRADEIVPGDAFRWCGHTVTAKDVQPKPRKLTLHPRHARVIVVDSPVESDDRELRLNYYDDEAIDLVRPPALAPPADKHETENREILARRADQ